MMGMGFVLPSQDTESRTPLLLIKRGVLDLDWHFPRVGGPCILSKQATYDQQRRLDLEQSVVCPVRTGKWNKGVSGENYCKYARWATLSNTSFRPDMDQSMFPRVFIYDVRLSWPKM